MILKQPNFTVMCCIKISTFSKENLWRLWFAFGTKNTNPMQKHQNGSRIMKPWSFKHNNPVFLC